MTKPIKPTYCHSCGGPLRYTPYERLYCGRSCFRNARRLSRRKRDFSPDGPGTWAAAAHAVSERLSHLPMSCERVGCEAPAYWIAAYPTANTAVVSMCCAKHRKRGKGVENITVTELVDEAAILDLARRAEWTAEGLVSLTDRLADAVEDAAREVSEDEE